MILSTHIQIFTFFLLNVCAGAGHPLVPEVLTPYDLTQRQVQIYAHGTIEINSAGTYYSKKITTLSSHARANLALHMVAVDIATDESGNPAPNLSREVTSLILDSNMGTEGQPIGRRTSNTKPLRFTYQPKISDLTSASASITLAVNQRAQCHFAIYKDEAIVPTAKDVFMCRRCAYNTSFPVGQSQPTRKTIEFNSIDGKV